MTFPSRPCLTIILNKQLYTTRFGTLKFRHVNILEVPGMRLYLSTYLRQEKCLSKKCQLRNAALERERGGEQLAGMAREVI